jgi:hypothetical protein
MSLFLKNKGEKIDHGRQVVATKDPYFLDELIRLVVGIEQSKVHQRLCCEFLGMPDDDVSCHLFHSRLVDGFRPAEVLPGGTFTEPLSGLCAYHELLEKLEQDRRTKGPLEWGYSPTEFSPFYTGWSSQKTETPLEDISWNFMRFYQAPGILSVMNAHHYTIERWADERTRHHRPHRLDVEVLNAGFLTRDCGRKGGTCQCHRELIFSPASYRSYPPVSPYLRLERQAMARQAYVNAIRQADDTFPFEPIVPKPVAEGEEGKDDDDDDDAGSDKGGREHTPRKLFQWRPAMRGHNHSGEDSEEDGVCSHVEESCGQEEESSGVCSHVEESCGQEEESSGVSEEEEDFDNDRSECRAVDWYLMAMYPHDHKTKENDLERYIQVPLGVMNEVDLVQQTVTVCPDTFQKLFCLSPSQDLQLLKWRKGLNHDGIDLRYLKDVMGMIHRCRVPLDQFVPKEILQDLKYPGRDIPGIIRPVPTRKQARFRKKRPVDFGFDFQEMSERGIIARPQGRLTEEGWGQLDQEWDKAWSHADQLEHEYWTRRCAAMDLNNRDDLVFGAWDKASECSTMWVPAEGYHYEGLLYKFRIISYCESIWRMALRWARRGQVLEDGLPVDRPPAEIFKWLLFQPGTLSCKPHHSVTVRKSTKMKPPELVNETDHSKEHRQQEPAWVETRGGHHNENQTWYWARMVGYPRDMEEEVEPKLPKVVCLNDFERHFGHSPTWDRNKWSKDWKGEFSALRITPGVSRLIGPMPHSLSSKCHNKSLPVCHLTGQVLPFCDITGVTGDTLDVYGHSHGYASYNRFCQRVYVVGLENAFRDEFGHAPTTDMNLWSNNRAAERKAYWVVTGRPHNDPAPSRPPFLRYWECDDDHECDDYDRRALCTTIVWDKHMQEPTLLKSGQPDAPDAPTESSLLSPDPPKAQSPRVVTVDKTKGRQD